MTIDAKIRISAIVDQAVKALREVKAEAAGVATAASGSGKVPFSDIGAGAKDAADKTKLARDEAAKLRAEQKAAAAEALTQANLAKKAAKDQKAAADDAAKAQRAQANQARQLGPQLTDIVVGLSTGQSPFTVLLQQGGQLKDVFGGVGNAGKALFSIFTVGRVVLGGFAAILGTVAVAAVQGRNESDALNKSIALTGNIAGTSAGQLDLQAKAIAASQKTSIGAVRETLAGLLASGEFSATSLDSAGRAAVALSKLTGQSAVDTIKQFDGMSSGVAAWAAKSNQAYNFLTVEQYKYIQSLEAQGRSQEAMKVALDALASTMEQRSAPAIGSLEKAWNKVKETLGSVLDRLKDIGRDETAESRLDALTKKLGELDAARAKLQGKQDRTSQLQLANTDADRQRLQSAVDTANAEVAANSRANKRIGAEKELEQQAILKESKSYQDSAAAVTEAGVQQQLALQLAALDQRQAAIELANAKGLTSEVAYSTALNEIDKKRLEAQAAAIERQIAIAGARKVERPQDGLANAAQVKGLQAQLAQVRGQIEVTTSKGIGIVAADALSTARDRASEWAQVWQKATDQVRQLTLQNAAESAAKIVDPIEGATAAALVKIAPLRQQFAELQAALNLKLTIDLPPGQRAEIERQIQELATQAAATIESESRKATFGDLQARFTSLNQTLVLQEQRLAIAVDQGALTAEDAEKRKFDARAKSLPQLEAILQAMKALASTTEEKNAIEGLLQDVLKLKDATTDFQRSAKAAAGNSFSTALTDISTGAKSAKSALLDMVVSFGKSMAEMLSKRLGDKLANQFIDAAEKFVKDAAKSGDSGGGGFWASVAQAVVKLFHTGGIAGSAGGSSRSVSPGVFANAARYHNEGIAGLKPREVPAILEEGEEILSEKNPRHIKNFSSSVGGIAINTTINGAQGSNEDNATAANDLVQRMRSVVTDWAAEQSRQGGVLAGRS